MLMCTGVSLELLSNVDILQCIDLGLYGEISSEMHRYSEAIIIATQCVPGALESSKNIIYIPGFVGARSLHITYMFRYRFCAHLYKSDVLNGLSIKVCLVVECL